MNRHQPPTRQQGRIPPSIRARFNQRAGAAFIGRPLARARINVQDTGKPDQLVRAAPPDALLPGKRRGASGRVNHTPRAEATARLFVLDAGGELELPAA